MARALAPLAQQPLPGSPLAAEDQLATFTVPPDFGIELVAADPELAKVVDVAFDDAGRMWACTAVEYPVDGNESAEAAELYRRGGNDRVLVFDTPCAQGRQTPHVFADGLAIALCVLPMRGGAFVNYGSELLFLRDRDGDGRADEREVVLSGFGIEDSHLMPHRFTRGPGNWIYLAQGAFNSSKVVTKRGEVVPFDQCKVGRMRPDGSEFEVVGTGLNNIWGFVIDRRGAFYVQEANDLGWPVVPLFFGASFPGIGDHRAKPYSPWVPELASFRVGGTGLSGLALAQDRGAWPPEWDGLFYVANPILGVVQSIALVREANGVRLEQRPDLVRSSDPWFRPIAIHFGPDGGLYVVDWYNKIISHNEVPRTHPERDKTRGRIWRVRPKSLAREPVPNLELVANAELPARLRANSTWEARAAWHQIVERGAGELVPALERMALDPRERVDVRVLASWCLDELHGASFALAARLAREADLDLRREAVRVLTNLDVAPARRRGLLAALADDPVSEVRQEVIRALDSSAPREVEDLAFLASLAREPIAAKAPDELWPGSAYEREFERSLVRAALEQSHAGLEQLLSAERGATSAEGRALACLALSGESGARRLAQLARELGRPLVAEELALLANAAVDGEVRRCVATLLESTGERARVLEALLAVRERVYETPLVPALARAARELAHEDPSRGEELLVRVASAFALRELEPEVLAILARAGQRRELQQAALRALVEMGSREFALFHQIARASVPGDALQREAALALAAGKSADAFALLFELWPSLPRSTRGAALRALASSTEGALALLAAIDDETVQHRELDLALLERLEGNLSGDARVPELRDALARDGRPVLVLSGGDDDYADTDVELAGAFTVEAWVRLAPGIGNEDGILGVPGGADFNFAAALFRVYGGPGQGDHAIARSAVEPDTWTHVAATRSASGECRVYLNGELDAVGTSRSTSTYGGLDVGRTTPSSGTSASLAELRVWDVERTPEEIGADFRRSYEGEPPPAHLAHLFAGASWGALHGGARIEGALDPPPFQSAEQARAEDERFAKYRALAASAGDTERGRERFRQACGSCHQVRGEGGAIGPNLDGAGLLGTEALLRALLTPSAGVEPGYRALRIETVEGELLDGLLVQQTDDALVLRRQDREDLHLSRAEIASMRFEKLSLMPQGLLESLPEGDVVDLFAFLQTLR